MAIATADFSGASHAHPHRHQLHKASRTLELEYGADERRAARRVPARAFAIGGSPGHGNPVLQTGKLKVALEQIEPAGQYAPKLTFSDGHDSGLLHLGLPRTPGAESAGAMGRLFAAPAAAGKSRDPDESVVADALNRRGEELHLPLLRA